MGLTLPVFCKIHHLSKKPLRFNYSKDADGYGSFGITKSQGNDENRRYHTPAYIYSEAKCDGCRNTMLKFGPRKLV